MNTQIIMVLIIITFGILNGIFNIISFTFLRGLKFLSIIYYLKLLGLLTASFLSPTIKILWFHAALAISVPNPLPSYYYVNNTSKVWYGGYRPVSQTMILSKVGWTGWFGPYHTVPTLSQDDTGLRISTVKLLIKKSKIV